MPKTRPETDREQKATEIVDAAIARLQSGGVDALSVAALARELGLAQNTIYWYFPTRDHLLVAAMGRIAERSINEGAHPEGPTPAAQAPSRASMRAQILNAVDRFAEVQPLRMALRERARSSPVLQEFEERLSAFLREALRGAFAPYVSSEDMDLAVESFMLASDGCYARGLGAAERRAVLGFVLDRLGIRE